MRIIDHYGYWYKNRENKNFLPREKEAIKLIETILKSFNKKTSSGKINLLDVGCGTGTFLSFIKKNFGFNCYGVEYSKDALKICKKRKLNVKFADLNLKIPFKNESFDIIYLGEVIEHLYDPDNFLIKINRVLKKNSYIIITTPNLCSWYNRILFLFGIQPLFIETSTKSKMIGAGILKKLKKDDHPVGHIRIFNYRALKDLLELYDFKIVKKSSATFEHFPNKILFLDKFFTLFPCLGSHLIICAKKIKNL